jgi:hypothetical protein
LQSPEPGVPLRLALDQNFPTDLLDAIREWLPDGVSLEHVAQIDERLPDLDDDELIVVLRQWGYDGLVTNNYKMLEVEHEVAAIVATKAVVVAAVGMGHDPIRAAGALLLELPGLPDRLSPKLGANVFWLNYPRRPPQSAWSYLEKVAAKKGTSAKTLWDEHRPDIDTVLLDRAGRAPGTDGRPLSPVRR